VAVFWKKPGVTTHIHKNVSETQQINYYYYYYYNYYYDIAKGRLVSPK